MIKVRRKIYDKTRLPTMNEYGERITVLVWAKFFNTEITDWLNYNVGEEATLAEYYNNIPLPNNTWLADRVIMLHVNPSGGAYSITIMDQSIMVAFRLRFCDYLVYNNYQDEYNNKV